MENPIEEEYIKKEGKMKKLIKFGAEYFLKHVDEIFPPEIKDAEGQETRICRDCGRVGCWMATDSPKYIQCKCGNEIEISIQK
jgi:hypothetical protein